MLLYLVIGALLLVALAVAAAVLIIATWRLQLPVVEEIEIGDFPPAVLDRQKNLGAKMEGAGFAFVGMQRERRGPQFEVWQALFRTGNGAVWGVVEAVRNESPRIVFHTFFADGRTVTTSDGEFADYNVTPGWELSESRWDSLKLHAVHHRQCSLRGGGQPMSLQDAEEFRERYVETARSEFAHLRELGYLKQDPAEDEDFEVVPWKAPKIALRMLLHSKRYKWAAQGHRPHETFQAGPAAGGEEPGREADLKGYTALETYKRDKQRGTALSLLGWSPGGALLFVAIMLLLGLFLVNGQIGFTTAGIILGVLLVHDFGHVAMMQVFGYRDYRVLVIPLVGRLAGNRKIRVSVWQEFVILVMGPLPGLIVGWGLLAYTYFDPALPEFWQKVGLWAVLINNLNFLAVLPYDGGRIVNLLIFQRLPAVRVIYLLLSGLSTLALVIATSMALGPAAFPFLWPLLLIGLFPFLALPENLRLARMAPWAKHNLSPGEDESDALLKAFLIVERTGSAKGMEKRGWTDFVDCVVRHGCSKKLGLVGSVAALLFLLACLHAPLWVFAGVAMGEGMRVRSEHRDLQARIDVLAPKVSWGGAVVTKKTRSELEMLRDNYQASLKSLYLEDASFTSDAFDYDSRGIFDPSEAIGTLRSLRWDEVATWIAEAESAARQETARVLVLALIGDAKEQAAAGNIGVAMVGLSKAYWAISTCEPKTSLGAWIDWLYLEHSLLREIEKLMGKRGIPKQYQRWFASTLRHRPRFEGNKMALLLLYDLQGTATPYLPPGHGRDARRLALREILADAGFALRRSEADRDFRKQGREADSSFSLASVMGATRILQGLPTRSEYRAGIAVAEAWEGQSEMDESVFEHLEPAQREIWKGRLDRIRRLQHFRLLGVAAFEIELSAHPASRESPAPVRRPPLPVRTELVTTPQNKYAVTSEAPDGTRFMWQLSPQFTSLRRAN